MKKTLLLAVFLVIWPVLVQAAGTIGVRSLSLEDNGKTLPVMVWYPAEVSGSTLPFDYYDMVKGRAILNAEPQAGQHPLIVFSHGLGMCSFQSVFLMEFLAENGYIVAAPDHDDAAMCHIGGGSDITDCQLTKALLKSMGNLDKSVQGLFPEKIHHLMDPAYRPRQISAVIDELLFNAEFGPRINPNQIGVMGHSFGGWTAEALAGAEIDCRDPESYSQAVCEAPDEELTTAVNNRKVCCQPPYRGQITHFRDERVKAALALGPGSFIFPNYDAMNNQVPVMILMGDHVEVDFAKNGYEAVKAMNSPTYLIAWRDIGHMTVSDVAYARPGAPWLRQFWCYDSKKALYQSWTLGFFQKYLENNEALFWQNLTQPHRLKIFFAEQ